MAGGDNIRRCCRGIGCCCGCTGLFTGGVGWCLKGTGTACTAIGASRALKWLSDLLWALLGGLLVLLQRTIRWLFIELLQKWCEIVVYVFLNSATPAHREEFLEDIPLLLKTLTDKQKDRARTRRRHALAKSEGEAAAAAAALSPEWTPVASTWEPLAGKGRHVALRSGNTIATQPMPGSWWGAGVRAAVPAFGTGVFRFCFTKTRGTVLFGFMAAGDRADMYTCDGDDMCLVYSGTRGQVVQDGKWQRVAVADAATAGAGGAGPVWPAIPDGSFVECEVDADAGTMQFRVNGKPPAAVVAFDARRKPPKPIVPVLFLYGEVLLHSVDSKRRVVPAVRVPGTGKSNQIHFLVYSQAAAAVGGEGGGGGGGGGGQPEVALRDVSVVCQ